MTELDVDMEYRGRIKNIKEANFLEVGRYIANFVRDNGPEGCMKDGEFTEDYKFLKDLEKQLADERAEFNPEYDRGMAKLYYWWAETHSPYLRRESKIPGLSQNSDSALTDDWDSDDAKYMCGKFKSLTGLPELHVIFTTQNGMDKITTTQEQLMEARAELEELRAIRKDHEERIDDLEEELINQYDR